MGRVREIHRLRRRVRVGAPDPSLTRFSGLVAVTELVDRLNMIKLLDRAIGPIKARDRGFSGGELLVGLASAQLAGEDFLVGLDRQRADAAGKVLAGAHVNAMKLEAFKYYYAPAGEVGVAGICAKPSPEIIKLQADIIAAMKPFVVETGPIGAFTAPHDDPATDAAMIQYVSRFVPKMSGESFNPHVSTGVAPRDYLDKMLAEPFEPFTFSPAGAAVYQLGPFGTAAKKLKAWE